MQDVIKKSGIERLRYLPLAFRFKQSSQERPAPRNQAEIDRLSKGWEQKSESTRARMARIGI